MMKTFKQSEKILVIQPLPGIGDLFWFDAILQSLSIFYKKPLTLMTKRRSYADQIYRKSDYVHDILWLDRPGIHGGIIGFIRLLILLRKKKFSCVWILHHSWRYRWVCKIAGIGSVIAFQFDKRWRDLHPTQRAEKLLKDNEIPLVKEPKFSVSQPAQKRIIKQLSQYKMPWVSLGIGGGDPSKKWSTAHFEDLAVWLSTVEKMSVFLLGGPVEKEEAERMEAQIQEKGGSAKALTHFSLEESIAFLDQVTFFIGNDTGMMNCSQALNKPTIALFIATPSFSYRSCLKPLKPLLDSTDILLSQVQKAVKEMKSPPYGKI